MAERAGEQGRVSLAQLRPGLLGSGIALAAMLATSAWAWPRIPDGARVAIHFGPGGEPDGFTGKGWALTMTPLLTAGLSVLFLLLPRVEPRQRHLVASLRALNAVWVGVAAFLAVAHAHVALYAAGYRVPAGAVMSAGVGSLLILIGNYLPKVRSNWFLGIRTPWTLSSERSWHRTHRLAGRLFVAAGLVALPSALLPPGPAQAAVVLAAVLAPVPALVAYSWWAWREDPDRQALGR